MKFLRLLLCVAALSGLSFSITIGDEEHAASFLSTYDDKAYFLTPEHQTAAWEAFKVVAARYPDFCETYDSTELISLVKKTPDTRSEKEIKTREALQARNVQDGASLLLYAEKGLGDTLMWIRYIPQLVQAFPQLKVTVSVQKPLICLKEMMKSIIFISGARPEEEQYDYCLSLFGLPTVLNAPRPQGTAYLEAVELDVTAKKEMNAHAGGRVKVGICFRGAKEHRYNEQRSVPLDAFKPIIERSDLCVFSLQVGDGQEKVKDFAGLIDLSPSLKSIANTAAYIKNLDLVITVDSMIGHLAGSLGVPTITLLCEFPDFRWALGTENASPWYNKHTLARQRGKEPWSEVIACAMRECLPK